MRAVRSPSVARRGSSGRSEGDGGDVGQALAEVGLQETSDRSVTPALLNAVVTQSALAFSVGSALRPRPHSQTAREAWSFSASPTPTALWGRCSSAGLWRPVALFTAGSTMTAPLLKMTWCSRPKSRIV
jgi:hypothetical protein